jgi:drug/metabolite transporter (DMT)-like permease
MYAYGALAIVFAAILWSADGFLRQGLYTVPSMLVVVIEHALGTLLYLPFVLAGWKHVRAMTPKQWGVLLWLCAVSGMLALFLYTKALSNVGYVPLSVVVLLQKLQPFFTIACAALVLRERVTARFVLTALVAAAGGYLVTFGLHVPAWSNDNATISAALMAVGAAACWGSSTVLSKYLLDAGPTTVITGLRLFLTTLLASAFALALGQYSAMAALEPSQWWSLVLIACTAGGVALGIYYWGLKRVPASHSAIYELTWPISALAFDYAFRGVFLSPAQLLGAVVLIGAMLSLPRRQG